MSNQRTDQSATNSRSKNGLDEATTTNQEVPWAWIKATNDILTNPPYKEPQLPVQLLPWLWLSDEYNSVRQIDKLLELEVTHVLTTNTMQRGDLERIRLRLQQVGISHHAIDAHDENGYDMIGLHWEECKQFFETARNHPKGKLVVHCLAGMNRSGLMAAAAMLTLGGEKDNNGSSVSERDAPESKRLKDTSLLNVVKILKRKRGMILTNLSFQKQLCDLAAREGMLGERPEGYSDDPLPASNFIRYGPPPNEALDRFWS